MITTPKDFASRRHWRLPLVAKGASEMVAVNWQSTSATALAVNKAQSTIGELLVSRPVIDHAKDGPPSGFGEERDR
jgi:hypothetical protein